MTRRVVTIYDLTSRQRAELATELGVDRSVRRLPFCGRLGSGCTTPPDRLWLAEISDPHTRHEGEHPLTIRPRRLYIVLTTQLPDSGLVIGPITAVTAAALTRLEQGHAAAGALVNAYIRVHDHLVPVDVQTLQVTTATRVTWYVVRTWLEQQLLDQHEQPA